MTTYIGNISNQIDCVKLVKDLKPGFVEVMNIYEDDIDPITDHIAPIVDQILKDARYNDPLRSEPLSIPAGKYDKDIIWRLNQIILKDAGYVDPVWSGTTYYPLVHFPKDVVLKLNEYLGAVCTACWISELKPGQIAPPHWDIDKRDFDFRNYGTIVKYSIHLGISHAGHAFFVDNECNFNEDPGAVYKWNDPGALHSGSNCGLESKFIMVFNGVQMNPGVTAEILWSQKELGDVAEFGDKFINVQFKYL